MRNLLIALAALFLKSSLLAAGGSMGGVGSAASNRLQAASLSGVMLTADSSTMNKLEELEDFLILSIVIDIETGLRVAVLKNIETGNYSVVKEVHSATE